MGQNITILWADDEIDLLKPQLFFLEKKGYDVISVTNGHDALDILEERQDIDIVFLDESMPGITGLETLSRLKMANHRQPVVMITKNEAENLMEEAIGSQIDDYLIKPVNPNQILLTLKRLIENKTLISKKTATDYQQEFRVIGMEIANNPNYEEWVDIYRKIISWELKLDSSENNDMKEILEMQKKDANREFFRYVSKNFEDWINSGSGPLQSHNLMKNAVLPLMNENKPVIMILLDNLRYDQWKIIEPTVTELFRIEREESFFSILPTATQYSRNAIFSGLLPAEIERQFPDWWLNDNEEGGKNMKEGELMEKLVNRLVRKEVKSEYIKITNNYYAKQLPNKALNFLNNDLTAIVYNFIDTLSHARTEMEVLKELASDEKAYRSLTLSWFINSPLWAAMQKLAGKDIKLVITTDHGTIRVKTPSKVIGDRETTTNLRYKVGKNLQYNKKDVLAFTDPAKVGLPKPNISSTFIFGKEDTYFLYPNNYTYYANLYQDTFQHGGVSLEEMICPLITLISK
jgi:CheY-like chemotaxis protein